MTIAAASLKIAAGSWTIASASLIRSVGNWRMKSGEWKMSMGGDVEFRAGIAPHPSRHPNLHPIKPRLKPRRQCVFHQPRIKLVADMSQNHPWRADNLIQRK